MGHDLIEELKKLKLCRLFWSEQISKELEQNITLEYEPLGEMGIYSKHYEFRLPYTGNEEDLLGTTAVIELKITSYNPDYDIKKAIEGKGCFHNVKIRVNKKSEILVTCHCRLWSNKKEEYCGDQSVLKKILRMDAEKPSS